MKLGISICLYRRPEAAAKVLKAVMAVPEFASLHKTVSIDWYDFNTQSSLNHILINNLKGFRTIHHHKRVGCNVNTKTAIAASFKAGAEFNIHIEDDILCARSAGSLMQWAAQKYKDDKQVYTVGLWRYKDGWLPNCGRSIMANEMSMVKRNHFFDCWGWGTWADRWAEMAANWSTKSDMEYSWDAAVQKTRGNRVEIVPMISRAQNIGWQHGTHRGDAMNSYWAGDAVVSNYEEIK